MVLYYEVFATVFYAVVALVFGTPYLLVTNNGPAVLDGNIIFNALLKDYDTSSNFLYVFDDGIRNIRFINNSTNMTSSFQFSSSEYKEGPYTMSISVSKNQSVESSIIAHNNSDFELHTDLIGKIIIFRENGANDVTEVAVGENITVATQIYDPNGYLTNAVIDYMWSVDYDRQAFMMNNFTYTYTVPETSIIISNVVALLPNNVLKTGMYHKKLTVKDPVRNVNVTGNPFIHHGEILLLNVTCNGSSPFMYCARPLKANESAHNFSCNQPIVSTTCSFPIEYYFRNYGTYQYGIYISNDVKDVRRIMQVVVYNVSKKPQLSTVIIPIACSLLTLIIIAGGIAYFIQQRNQMAIEVANFDFQEDPEPYAPRTFFEQVFDSFMCSCRGSAAGDTDMFSEEEEPLMSRRRSRKLSF